MKPIVASPTTEFEVRCVVQRVKNANVTIDGISQGKLDHGLMIFVGFSGNPGNAKDWDEVDDHTRQEIESKLLKLCKKIITLRVFSQGSGPMALDAKSVGAGFYLVSQFTLFADLHKGCRPSFSRAMQVSKAKPVYDLFVTLFRSVAIEMPVLTGQFGADMQVAMSNDGPVTIIIDTAGA